MGLLRSNALTLDSVQMGSVAVVLLFSIALADKYHVLVKEREEARQAAITNERIAREAQEELITHLQDMDRMKDMFLVNTSHELRTPLNGIIGIAEAMHEGISGELPGEARQNLEMIVASGRRLASLVNDILDYSKLKTGRIDLVCRALDLRSLVRVVIKCRCTSCAEKNSVWSTVCRLTCLPFLLIKTGFCRFCTI
jgi:signal transduction histidine kinase